MGLCTTAFGRRRLSRTGETSARRLAVWPGIQQGKECGRYGTLGRGHRSKSEVWAAVYPVHPMRSTSDAVRQCSGRSSDWGGCSDRFTVFHSHFVTSVTPHPLPPAPTLTLFYLFLCLSVNGFPCLAWMPRHHHLHIHHPFPQLRAFSSWRSELDSYWFFPSCQMDVGKPLLSPLVKIMPWSYSCLNSRRRG